MEYYLYLFLVATELISDFVSPTSLNMPNTEIQDLFKCYQQNTFQSL